MFGTWRYEVENISKNLKELKNNNENNFKNIKKTLDNNSKTVTIPLSEYEKLKEKVSYYEKRMHQLDYELNNMVDNYLQFAKDNGVTPEIKEFTLEEDYYCKDKPIYEDIYVPAFRFYRYKGYKGSEE